MIVSRMLEHDVLSIHRENYGLLLERLNEKPLQQTHSPTYIQTRMTEIIITILVMTFLYISIYHDMTSMQNYKIGFQNN